MIAWGALAFAGAVIVGLGVLAYVCRKSAPLDVIGDGYRSEHMRGVDYCDCHECTLYPEAR